MIIRACTALSPYYTARFFRMQGLFIIFACLSAIFGYSYRTDRHIYGIIRWNAQLFSAFRAKMAIPPFIIFIIKCIFSLSRQQHPQSPEHPARQQPLEQDRTRQNGSAHQIKPQQFLLPFFASLFSSLLFRSHPTFHSQ